MSSAEDTQRIVKWYQTILGRAAGYSSVPVNGNHNDAQTRNAFRDFQNAHALEASGFLTVESNFAVNQVALQWIYRRSLANTIGKSSEVLKDQIKEFQLDYGLDADGKVGPETMEKMVNVLNGALPLPYIYPQLEFSSEQFLGVEKEDVQNEPEPVQAGPVTSAGPGVIGTDDREAQTNTINEPNRWVCLLEVGMQTESLHYDFKGITGQRRGFARSLGGTGLLISPRHILTAAHIVKLFADKEAGLYRTMYISEKVIVSPGHNGGFGLLASKRLREPYGTAVTTITPKYPDSYSNYPSKTAVSEIIINDFDDFALIVLPTTIEPQAPVQTRKFLLNGKWQTQDTRLPALGYWGGDKFQIHATTPQQLDGREIQTIGYPSERPKVETRPRKPWMQWLAKGTVDNARSNSANHPFIFFHTADSTDSQSGSPIWTISRSGGKDIYTLVGIVNSVKPDGRYNLAVALTERVLKQIQQWASTTFDYTDGSLTVK
jgi:V8-like Glu-specific endopeptidase